MLLGNPQAAKVVFTSDHLCVISSDKINCLLVLYHVFVFDNH
jgi:hypothetical protein